MDTPYEIIRAIYEQKIPFHEVLGLRVVSAAGGRAQVAFDFRPELVGNYRTSALHGGVVAAVLDVAGSVAVLTGFPPPEAPRGLGTIDMRSDYLLPARGKSFVAEGRLLRPGRSLAVTRMELRNETGELLAVGTASYRVSLRERGEKAHDILEGWLD